MSWRITLWRPFPGKPPLSRSRSSSGSWIRWRPLICPFPLCWTGAPTTPSLWSSANARRYSVPWALPWRTTAKLSLTTNALKPWTSRPSTRRGTCRTLIIWTTASFWKPIPRPPRTPSTKNTGTPWSTRASPSRLFSPAAASATRPPTPATRTPSFRWKGWWWVRISLLPT